MSAFLHDLRYAVRTLVKSPGFSAVAIATLALGIGANAAIFALVDRVLIRSLPVADPGSLVLLSSPGPSQGHTWSDDSEEMSFSYPMYRDLRDKNDVFSGLIAVYPFQASVATRDTELAAGELVSGNSFAVLGVAPAVGRLLGPDDDRVPGGHPVAVLSHGYWMRRFGGDPAVVNATIVVNNQPLTVVGVTRAPFSGVQPGRPADLFVPLMMKSRMTPLWSGLDDPKDYWLQLIGRLKPGLSRARAQSELLATYRPLLQELLPKITGWDDLRRRQFLERRIILMPGAHGRTVLAHGYGTSLLSLAGMVALVLLIACSNLAGLLAARGAARQREYGIRLAIGASRAQLVRQSLAECLLFAAAGGGLGLLVASWTLHALLSTFPPEADLRLIAAEIDPRVLGFAALVSIAAGLLFGVSPALRAARLDPAHTLRGAGRGAAGAGADVLRFRRGLVTGQIALTLVLLVGAGFFANSLRNLMRVELGFRPDRVLGFSISPELNGYSPERTGRLARELTDALAALPGVRSVSAAEISTLTGDDSGGNVTVEGADPNSSQPDRTRRNAVGPDYFATLGIPLLAGRELTWRDEAAAPKVAVVNESFARRFFGDRGAVGRRFKYGRGDQPPDIEVVGVVANSKSAKVSEPEMPFAYVPYLQDPKVGFLTFYVATERAPAGVGAGSAAPVDAGSVAPVGAGSAAPFAAALRDAVRRLDPRLPVQDVKTLRRQVDESLVTDRLVMLLAAAFGGLAVLLAAIGIYGVLAFSVARRRQEIGVRMALGADPAAVRALILGELGRFLLVGAAVGLPAAFALGRAVESILYGVRATDPRVFALGTALMAAVAILAGYPPARRAAKTNAIDALRAE